SIRYAVEQREARRALQESAEALHSLSQRLMQTQEAERRHLARELHDEFGQSLTALKLNLQALQQPDSPPAAALLEESLALVERMLQEARELALALRPSLLDDLGLVPALEWLVRRQAERAGLAVEFAADALETRPSGETEA